MTEKQRQKKPQPNLFRNSYIKMDPGAGTVTARFEICDGEMDEDRLWVLMAIDSGIYEGVQKALETHPIAKDALERYCALHGKNAGQNITP